MATIYNAPKSQWNKDEVFASLTITEGKRIEFTEATIKENDERIMVYAWVTSVESVTDYGDKSLNSDTWKPQLCKFAILKKPVTIKEKEVKPTPGMVIAAHFIAKMEGKPFAGSLDFQKTEGDIAWIALGQNSLEDATPLPDAMKELLEKQHFNIKPIEALEKLKDVTIPELGNGGSYKKGYSSGQTMKAQLEDKIDWLLAQLEPESKLYQLAQKCGYNDAAKEQFVHATVLDLATKILG